jgi:hypothetical protein
MISHKGAQDPDEGAEVVRLWADGVGPAWVTSVVTMPRQG